LEQKVYIDFLQISTTSELQHFYVGVVFVIVIVDFSKWKLLVVT
jgi:hypothetical protein